MTRLDAILSGALDPIPDTDFGLVVAALREAHENARLYASCIRSADESLAAEKAAHDVTAKAAAIVAADRDALRVERDALKARLDAIGAAHREPVGASALRAEMLDDARPGTTRVTVERDGRGLSVDLAPHLAVTDVAPEIDRALAHDAPINLAAAVRAYDLAASMGIPLVAHAMTVRDAGRNAGLDVDAFFRDERRDWTGLLAACRAHVVDEARNRTTLPEICAAPSEASDGFGLGLVGGAA